MLFFNQWKREFIGDFFPEYNLFYLKRKNYIKFIFKQLVNKNYTLIIWGYNEAPKYKKIFNKAIKLIRVEDGFLRSTELGKKRSKPLSLAADFTGLYFNSSAPSDLENLLNFHDFSSQEILHAKECMELIKKYGVSKYNHAPKISLSSLIGSKKRKRILVIGQVEQDASIRYGCAKPITNNDLVKLAHAENPDCEIIYKIHPDVLAAIENNPASFTEISSICTVIASDIAPSALFAEVEKVYTITSLMGFEALIFGLPVICVGAPFYSNWGITDDRQPIERRIRKRTLEEIFCAAYLLYPRYPYGNILSIIEQLGCVNKLKEKTEDLVF
nr:hypothetical protein [Legionella sp. 27cVA30]